MPLTKRQHAASAAHVVRAVHGADGLFQAVAVPGVQREDPQHLWLVLGREEIRAHQLLGHLQPQHSRDD